MASKSPGTPKQIPFGPCEHAFLGACGFLLFLLMLLEEPEAYYYIVPTQDVPDMEMARITMQQNVLLEEPEAS